jgi:hypothetical protein
MKKLLAAVFSVALVLAVGSSVAKAQGSATDILGITVAADGNIFIGVAKDDNNDDTTASGITYGANLAFTKILADQGKIVLKIRGGDGTAAIGSLGAFRGGINDNNYSYGGAGLGDNVWLKEFYFVQPIADNLVSVTFGKVGAVSSGVNGANSVGSFFTNDPTVDLVDRGSDNQQNPYSLKIAINPIPILTITYGYSTQEDPNDASGNVFTQAAVFNNGFNAFEVAFKGIEQGTIRAGFWFSNQKNANYKEGAVDGDPAGAMGIWLNGDKVLADNFTVFARFGMRLDSTEYAAATFGGQKAAAGMNIQAGTTISGALFGRSADKVFVGIGFANALNDLLGKDYGVNDIHAEINYSYQVNDGIAIIPFFQFANTNVSVPSTLPKPDPISGMAAGVYTKIKF